MSRPSFGGRRDMRTPPVSTRAVGVPHGLQTRQVSSFNAFDAPSLLLPCSLEPRLCRARISDESWSTVVASDLRKANRMPFPICARPPISHSGPSSASGTLVKTKRDNLLARNMVMLPKNEKGIRGRGRLTCVLDAPRLWRLVRFHRRLWPSVALDPPRHVSECEYALLQKVVLANLV